MLPDTKNKPHKIANIEDICKMVFITAPLVMISIMPINAIKNPANLIAVLLNGAFLTFFDVDFGVSGLAEPLFFFAIIKPP